MSRRTFDVFISHASEDKDGIARPLAAELRVLGLRVWFDEFELKFGDSLRETIERGLATSRYGIVIVSPAFFNKKWPTKELNGLFSRELSGRKNRILPLRHKLSVDEFRKRLPIQADRYAPSSDTNLAELCHGFIKVIKPELLELQTLRSRASESADSFLKHAKKQYPGYEFSVQVSSSDHRTHVSMKPDVNFEGHLNPTFKLTFSGAGVAKAKDFISTGRPQSWSLGEASISEANIPFMPQDMSHVLISAMHPRDNNPQPIRVTFGTSTKNVEFALLYREIVRMGLQGGEFLLSATHEAIKFRVTYSLGAQSSIDFAASWQLSGNKAQACERAIAALDCLREGSELAIFDLTGDQAPLRLQLSPQSTAFGIFDDNTKALIQLCAQIERHFGVSIVINREMDSVTESGLMFLDCLINQKDYPAESISGTFTIRKGESPQVDDLLCHRDGGSDVKVRIFTPADSYPGYFEIFGTRVPTRSTWGLSADAQFDSAVLRTTYCQANPGELVTIPIRSLPPVKVVWSSPT